MLFSNRSAQRSPRGANRLRRSGFTLIELLVVIAIIATLASIVAPQIFGNVGDARRNTAKSQLQILALAIDSYRLDTDAFPTTQQGLDPLRTPPQQMDSISVWRGPYLRQTIPLDPWGRQYVYVSPGVANPTSFDLYTLGKDGRVGGTGEDADQTSWNGPVSQ